MAYLVWVPRYKYKLFNVASAVVPIQKIDVVFEDKTRTKSNGSANGDYLTHPAFTFGSQELDGIWVGKFETTGTTTTPTIKPNATAITSNAVSVEFATTQKFSSMTTTYGLTAANDAHMIKNMEWGAVAYLSQSDYGKYGNPIYTNAAGLEKQVWINNNSAYTTGCAGTAVAAPAAATCNQYNTTNGVKTSTTGNIYGIYDMVGGTGERTMGAMYNIGNSTIAVATSEFVPATIDSLSFAKYIDKYTYGTTQLDQVAYDRRQLGDATGETRSWNGDQVQMINNTLVWFYRGVDNGGGAGAGMFAFTSSNGPAATIYGFRAVLIGD